MEVAVKFPNKQTLSPDEIAMFREEVKNMRYIMHTRCLSKAFLNTHFIPLIFLCSKNSHPHIIRLMGACTEVGKLQIITERCATDLEKLLAEYALFILLS